LLRKVVRIAPSTKASQMKRGDHATVPASVTIICNSSIHIHSKHIKRRDEIR